MTDESQRRRSAAFFIETLASLYARIRYRRIVELWEAAEPDRWADDGGR